MLKFAFKGKHSAQAVFHSKIYGLIYFLHVEALCRRAIIGQHHTIATEVAIVGHVCKIATIGPILAFLDIEDRLYMILSVASQRLELHGRIGGAHLQALVLPVPYKLASHGGIVFVDVVELSLITHRVTHGMGVLTLYVGADALLALFVVFETRTCDAHHVIQRTVHGAGNCTPGAIPFIMSQTCRVKFFNGLHHILEVLAVSAFIARTPHDDTGVVTQGAHMTGGTFYHCRTERLLMR